MNSVWKASISNKGWSAWLLTTVLTSFYVLIYWYPNVLGYHKNGNTGFIALFDSFSKLLKNKPASQWFVYGVLYTIAILFFGVKMLRKYRHNRYIQYRTFSVIFFQLIFAFLLPELMMRNNLPYNDFKNIWPLNYYFFFDWHLNELFLAGNFGLFILFWGVISFLIIAPILTYFYGKRWYCSWVCGCGGLAETAGDSFRHLSDKSLIAWTVEKFLVYSILAFAIIMTGMTIFTQITRQATILFLDSFVLRDWYGFFIGAAFSGVVGVGFYPILGSRIWCRFGCPMAAYLGILQKYVSRFRISVNGEQCISCGNCSTFCEMGIDVRAYAQEGQDFVRASCVGCGLCADVCPRGVLKLENSPIKIVQKH
ncbi:MAG: 4Fe-4S binding protein [Saprospiraceae bacterium]|nr:4Fe-4S binding protein [Saprospiraceae bacterium]